MAKDSVLNARARAQLPGARGARRLPKRFLLSSSITTPDYCQVTLGVVLVSESNARGHWGPRAKRAATQRNVAKLYLQGVLTPPLAKGLVQGGLLVRLTRVAPCVLDDDNLRGACKALRDGVADALGLASDRDKRVTWEYQQEKGEPRTYGARVRIERRGLWTTFRPSQDSRSLPESARQRITPRA